MVSRIRAAQYGPSTRKSTTGLAADLVLSGCVVFGEFHLRSGEVSPIYLDLRRLASHPRVLARAAAAYLPELQRLKFEVLAGIPYAGLPIATAISLQTGKPMVYPRREVKGYGRQAAVEGDFRPGDRAVLIDDVATSGGSKIEAAARLRGEGLAVADVIVLVDRQAGAGVTLEAEGLSLHAVFKLDDLLDEWGESGLVPQEQIGRVRTSLAHHRIPS
jgi:uridine monophosphate synthetase